MNSSKVNESRGFLVHRRVVVEDEVGQSRRRPAPGRQHLWRRFHGRGADPDKPGLLEATASIKAVVRGNCVDDGTNRGAQGFCGVPVVSRSATNGARAIAQRATRRQSNRGARSDPVNPPMISDGFAPFSWAQAVQPRSLPGLVVDIRASTTYAGASVRGALRTAMPTRRKAQADVRLSNAALPWRVDYCVGGYHSYIHNDLRVLFVIIGGRRVVDAAYCEGFHSCLFFAASLAFRLLRDGVQCSACFRVLCQSNGARVTRSSMR